MSKLTDELANASPEEINTMNWAIVHAGLVKAQQHLEADGGRHSWLDGYVAIAKQEAGLTPPDSVPIVRLERERVPNGAVAWYLLASDGPQFMFGTEVPPSCRPKRRGWLYETPQHPGQKPFAFKIGFPRGSGYFVMSDLDTIDPKAVRCPLYTDVLGDLRMEGHPLRKPNMNVAGS